ncbi:MAG: HAMP domain-containing histidine kinase, partial [Clostridia bacterium]|nr:HAMP domain-containing histidine kinase [Clostridia bacterium]
MFTGFFLFTVVTVGLLWLFQVVFMNSFYKTIRMYSIHQSARDIILCLDRGEDPEDAVRNAVLTDQMDVLISDDTGRRVSIGLSSGNDVFSELRSWELMALYYDTLRDGGNVFQHYTQQNQNNANIIHPADNAESVLYLHAVQGERGDGRLAIIFAGIEPVRSTIETLRVQLGAITVIMLLLSIGLALIISLRISRPIVRMNRAAAQLAQGNYNVYFAESGAKETTELARSLNVAAYELSRVEGLRRDLLANVSHDLRTPLTMITGYAEVMRDIPGENTPENVQVIIDEATRLTTLVNDLLDLSRLQSGKIDLNKTNYSLTASIRTILQRYDRLIDYHFVFENSGDVRIFADELKITQVI